MYFLSSIFHYSDMVCMFILSPHGARVSGVVEETPGRLEYEVALYKEAPPVTRHNNHSVDLPVDQVTGVRSLVFYLFIYCRSALLAIDIRILNKLMSRYLNGGSAFCERQWKHCQRRIKVMK